MKRPQLFLILLSAVLSACQNNSKSEKREDRPNVVLILTDDQGYADAGVYGAKDFKTPNLDQLASEGALLTNYYAPQAVCSASRAGILTGCYPNRISIFNALGPNAGKGLHPDETTIADMLKEQGYATAIFGKWHLGDAPELLPTNHGFDEYLGIPYSNDMWPFHPWQGRVFNFGPLPLIKNTQVIDTITDQSQLTTRFTEGAIDFINRKKDDPFFLYVAHPQPHVPLYVSNKFKGKSANGLYGDVIMELDWSVGQIMKTLKDNGLEENTLIIYTSDNGPWLSYGNHAGSAGHLREGKGTVWEGGQREPFIVKFPPRIQGGSIIDVPVMGIDILPTIASLTGARLPKLTIDGKDVLPLLTKESTESPHEAYFFYYDVNQLQGVRYGDYKLYFEHTYRTMAGQSQGKEGLPGDYTYITLDEVELYHLPTDPGERTNIAQKHPEVVAKIEALADEMRLKLGDALRDQTGNEVREPAYTGRD
jgi:arylsulfatase A-like enzyme